MSLVSSKFQTKLWRQSQKWWKGGKHNECEKHQIEQTEYITNGKLHKSKKRFNRKTLEFKDYSNPLTFSDGFEWTEDLDGVMDLNKKLYFNFKFVCDKGGIQNRTLRELYIFIETQYEYLSKTNVENICFVNILDGDTCFVYKKHFQYLKNQYDNDDIFIGDTYEFSKWFKKHFTPMIYSSVSVVSSESSSESSSAKSSNK